MPEMGALPELQLQLQVQFNSIQPLVTRGGFNNYLFWKFVHKKEV